MAETVARRGGLTVLPQDIPLDVVESVIEYVKSRHTVYDTPITLSPTHTVGDALGLIHKRAHGALVVVGDDGTPAGIFTEHDAVGFDRFSQLKNVMSSDLMVIEDGTPPDEIYDGLSGQRLSVAPVVDSSGRLIGCITRKGALRSTIYRPRSTPTAGCGSRSAVGINGDPATKAKSLLEMGADVLVIDTPRPPDPNIAGDRRGPGRGARRARSSPATSSPPKAPGDLIIAGADIVKVGSVRGRCARRG
jgi:IMP dehydrogenase